MIENCFTKTSIAIEHAPRLVEYSVIAILGIACTLLFFTGCSALVPLVLRFDRNVATDAELVGGYQLHAIYELQQDVFLFKKEVPAKRKMLVPPKPLDVDPGFGLGEWSAPASVDAYLESKSEWSEILSVIPKGTRIKCTAIHEYGAPGWGSSIYLHGELLSGSHGGTVVDFTELSHVMDSTRRNPRPIAPDPRIVLGID